MEREVTAEMLQDVLEELSYPAFRPDAAAELRDVTVVFENGEANLGAIISDTGHDSYETPEALKNELEDRIPDVAPP